MRRATKIRATSSQPVLLQCGVVSMTVTAFGRAIQLCTTMSLRATPLTEW